MRVYKFSVCFRISAVFPGIVTHSENGSIKVVCTTTQWGQKSFEVNQFIFSKYLISDMYIENKSGFVMSG